MYIITLKKEYNFINQEVTNEKETKKKALLTPKEKKAAKRTAKSEKNVLGN